MNCKQATPEAIKEMADDVVRGCRIISDPDWATKVNAMIEFVRSECDKQVPSVDRVFMYIFIDHIEFRVVPTNAQYDYTLMRWMAVLCRDTSEMGAGYTEIEQELDSAVRPMALEVWSRLDDGTRRKMEEATANAGKKQEVLA